MLDAAGESLGLPSAAPLARLAPGVAVALGAAWPPEALARHLTAGLPPVVEKPTAFLGHRLAVLPPNPDACDCRACAPPKPVTCLTHRVDVRAGETCPYCEIAADRPRRPPPRTCAAHADVELTPGGVCRSCRADRLVKETS